MSQIGVISVAIMVTGGEIDVLKMSTNRLIEVLMMADADLGLKRPSTITLTIYNKLFIVIWEMKIGPRPATHPPINLVTMVYCCVHLLILVVLMIVFMKM